MCGALLAERVVIAVGIATLWPWVFGVRNGWYSAFAAAVLAALAVVAFRRWARFRRAVDGQREAQYTGSHPQDKA